MKFLVLITKLLFFIPESRSAKKVNLRIIGGRNATADELPYIVELLYPVVFNVKTRYLRFCSGAVIATTWTLTAAHCQMIQIVVKIGSDAVWAIKFIRHPKFRISMDGIYNDIALVKHDLVKLREYAKLSAMEYSSLYGQEAKCAGFGADHRTLKKRLGKNTKNKLQNHYTNYTMPSGLLVLTGLIVACDINIAITLRPSICVAVSCNNRQTVRLTAPGDSGSPLVHESGIVGVLSSSSGALTEGQGFAGYYVPTSYFYEWLRKKIKANTDLT